MQRRPATLFWDVDTQVDFVRESGALYVPGAEKATSNLARLTAAARDRNVPVVASADDHHLSDAEISDDPDFQTTYPPHCMHGTPGQEKVRETSLPEAEVFDRDELSDEEVRRRLRDAGSSVLILKNRVDVFTNPNTEKILAELDPARIVVYGVALDVCNKFTVEGLLARGRGDLVVVTDATAALDPDRGRRLLEEWSGKGVRLATTDEVLADVR